MDKHRLALIVIGVLGIAILAGGWFLGLQPQLDRMARAADQTASVEQLNDVQADRNAALAADNDNLEQFRAELTQARAAIPEARNQSEFITQMDAAARAAGVTVTALTFDPPVDFTAPAGVPVQLPASGRLIGVAVTLTAVGERGQLEAFAQAVQTSTRILTVGESQYSGGEGPGTLTLSGTTWVLQSPS